MQITNKEFLQAIFGEEWNKVHVTAFTDDPEDIKTQDQRMRAWAGGLSTARRLRSFSPLANQYFTISLFNADQNGEFRRKKEHFDATFVIVLDDVMEKIPEENAKLLPEPSYKMLSSAGSEQWGFILDEPETVRSRVENLLDGLVSQGLVPDGKDTGMKGVTRYVRLPEGSNTKRKRYVDGKPFSCDMVTWNPESYHSMDDLAKAFNIDLDEARPDHDAKALDTKTDAYRNHPIWDHVNQLGANGDWMNIECPNAHKHSNPNDTTGAAIYVRDDGSVAFQCHHGSCNGDSDEDAKTTGLDIIRQFDIETEVNAYVHDLAVKGNTALAEALGREVIEQEEKHEINEIIRNDDDFNILRYVYLPPENRFYDVCTGSSVSPEALKNVYLRTLSGKKDVPTAVTKFHQERNADLCIADGIGWIPWSLNRPKRSELVVEFGNRRLVNSWTGIKYTPKEADISVWLNHVDYLIPDEQQKNVVLDYLALTFQQPIEKPAFTILHRGCQGNGKDLMLKPLALILGAEAAGSAKIDEIANGWGDYIAKKKFLIIEEVDKAQNKHVNNSLKTLLAPTATGFQTLNMKGGGVINQYDAMCTYMMSNRRNPLQFEEGERRYYVVDSWVQPEDAAHYKAIDAVISKQETLEGVLHFLLNRDISAFNHKRLPDHTEGYLEIMDTGRYDYEIMIEELVREKKAPFNLPLFTLTTLKAEMKKHDVGVIVNSLIDAVEKSGYVKCRGAKKFDGKTKNTPVYFIPKDRYGANWGRKDEYDFYETYQSGGGL